MGKSPFSKWNTRGVVGWSSASSLEVFGTRSIPVHGSDPLEIMMFVWPTLLPKPSFREVPSNNLKPNQLTSHSVVVFVAASAETYLSSHQIATDR